MSETAKIQELAFLIADKVKKYSQGKATVFYLALEQLAVEKYNTPALVKANAKKMVDEAVEITEKLYKGQ